MNDKGRSQWIRGTEYEEYLKTKEQMNLKRRLLRKWIIDNLNLAAEEDECPTACEIITDVQDALFQLSDTVNHLRLMFHDEINGGTCQDFVVKLVYIFPNRFGRL